MALIRSSSGSNGGGGGLPEVNISPNAQLSSSDLQGSSNITVSVTGSTLLGPNGLNASLPIMTVSPAPSAAQSNIGSFTRYDGGNSRVLSIDTNGNIYASSNIGSQSTWNVSATYTL